MQAVNDEHKSVNNVVDYNLEETELMAVDALMDIIDFSNTPRQVTLPKTISS